MNEPWAVFLISSIAWQGMAHRDAIAQVRAAGFSGVEILCKPGHFEYDNRAHVEEVEAVLDEWPEAIVTFHSPFYDVDPASPDPDARERAVQELMQALRVASLLRAEVMTVHARSRAEAYHWDADNLMTVQASLEELMRPADELGIRLAVENGYPPCLIARLLTLFPALGACLDTGHAHLAGQAVELMRQLAARAFVVHLHDNAARDLKDEHLVPGQGTIPWKELTEALRAGCFGGRLVMEVLMVETLGKTLEMVKHAIEETGLYELTRGEEKSKCLSQS